MTAYATRSPLQLLSNTHMMSDPQKSTRRTSARLADKEDVPLNNGISQALEKGRAGHLNGATVKQGKVAVNGIEATAGTGRGKRKKIYHENDDDFMFTRTRSKRAKATPAVQPSESPMEDIPEEASRPAPIKKPRKRTTNPGSPKTTKTEKEIKEVKRRRSPRNSGDGVPPEPDPPVLEVKKRRTKDSGIAKPKSHKSTETLPSGVNNVSSEITQIANHNSQTQKVAISQEITKISLPFADTPIIRRNQEMRRGAGDGSRRSSLGNRGRRASSLIDGGKSNALPHDEVESSQFYKHIESGLPEPRRMRQLLTWCGTRALADKPSFASEDSGAKLAAREIQQQLLRDFSAKSEMSDWFSREDTKPPPQPPQPNPKNVSNLAKIQELERQIERLHIERQTWESLLKPPLTTTTTTATTPSLAPLLSSSLPDPQTITPSLLASETQSSLLSTLQSTHPPFAPSLSEQTRSRVEHITQNIEFQIDTFADNVHLLERYCETADRVAGRVLELSAQALEERSRNRRRAGGGGSGEGGEAGEVGTRDVLRGLSRVIE